MQEPVQAVQAVREAEMEVDLKVAGWEEADSVVAILWVAEQVAEVEVAAVGAAVAAGGAAVAA